ncbi:serine/threonine protein kinase [Actinomadura sp. KC216]|uniref:protein kinase domain-containing protein n=1 Tax=Actinomadura sp. KC216 TaxID=2530370 RepID=UPI00105116EF|nr:lipopolysaccharide kinase InaA family protein [Actinomadura sp. KC216]TDB86954.1 serine/threonine protein kinase [Actinomadura sp. KC216]
MKAGEVLHGYRIVTEPTNDGGGKCMWAFAERDGHEYFIKRFLEPKLPREGRGSEASRRARLRECALFENRHRTIMDRLRPDMAGAGNLVLATDFFHERATYYKVTERIDTASMIEPHALDARNRRVLLRTLALNLRLLHRLDVVHGDLKPTNVLIHQRALNAFHTAKVIDFDDAYLSGDPPPPDLIAGDSRYGAPEWVRYLRGDAGTGPADLTTSADIFSMGLLTHLYLTGSLPAYDTDDHDSPAEAVDAGVPLRADMRLAPGTRDLIEAMTAAEPERRPTAEALFDAFQDPAMCALDRSAATARTGSSRIRRGLGASDAGTPSTRRPPHTQTPGSTD